MKCEENLINHIGVEVNCGGEMEEKGAFNDGDWTKLENGEYVSSHKLYQCRACKNIIIQ